MLGAEKWLGKIKKFVQKTHGGRDASLRAVQRYVAFLAVRIKNRRTMYRPEMKITGFARSACTRRTCMHRIIREFPNMGISRPSPTDLGTTNQSGKGHMMRV